jgi:hypothetical protein
MESLLAEGRGYFKDKMRHAEEMTMKKRIESVLSRELLKTSCRMTLLSCMLNIRRFQQGRLRGLNGIGAVCRRRHNKH